MFIFIQFAIKIFRASRSRMKIVTVIRTFLKSSTSMESSFMIFGIFPKSFLGPATCNFLRQNPLLAGKVEHVQLTRRVKF